MRESGGVKNLVPDAIVGQDLADTDFIGVREKNLPEMVLSDHLEKRGDAGFVQFVEDVVQQEDGLDLVALVGIVELRETKCQGEGLLLPLRPEAFDRLPVD